MTPEKFSLMNLPIEYQPGSLSFDEFHRVDAKEALIFTFSDEELAEACRKSGLALNY